MRRSGALSKIGANVMKFRRLLLSFLIGFLSLPAIANAQLSSGVIDSKRAVNWSQAGIPGPLPDTGWPVCQTISAYSGSPSTINSALSSCASGHSAGGVVVLGAGTFNLSGAVNLPSSGHIVLRGQGAGATKLAFTSNSGSACPGGFICLHGNSNNVYRGQNNNAETVHNVTGGMSQGSTVLTLDSVSGITANASALIMNQCDTGYSGTNCTTGSSIDNGGYFECAAPWTSAGHGCAVPSEGPNGSGWRCHVSSGCGAGNSGAAWEFEMFLVTAVNGNNVTISRPLHHPNWTTAQSPQVIVFNPTQRVGVENLTVDASADKGSSGSPGPEGINIGSCYQCWVSGVAVINVGSHHIALAQSINSVIQNSYFYGNPVNYGDNTALRVVNGSMNLLQNNICHAVSICVFNDGPEEGDVVAYNYGINETTNGATNGQMKHATSTHSAGDDWFLFEGNEWIGSNDDLDHGGHLSQTYFRNFMWGWDSWVNGPHGGHTAPSFSIFPYSSGYASRYFNLVANVWGTPGVHKTYSWLNSYTNQFGSNQIYILGAGNQSTGTSQPSDPLSWCSSSGVSNFTTMCWANWDVVNNSTQFNSSEVPTKANSYPNSVPTACTESASCPDSLYLSSKPSWWTSSIPFPAVGYDVSGGNVGQCSGTLGTTSQAGLPAPSGSHCSGGKLNAAWAEHVNANPAMACYFSIGGLPDGSGPVLPFDGSRCYGNSSSSNPPPTTPLPPTNLDVTVN
jgi:hypothetical protein